MLVLLSLPFAAQAPSKLTANPSSGVTETESYRVLELLRQEFNENNTNMVVIISRSQMSLTSAAGQQLYDKFVSGLADVKNVSRVVKSQKDSLLTPQSADGKQAITVAQIPLENGAPEALTAIRQYVEDFEAQNSEFQLQVTGGQAIANDFTYFSEYDTKRSEVLALPLIAVVVVVVFGALVATGLPLVVGLLSISTAMAGLYFLAQVMGVSIFAQSIVTMLGLAAGIDYALLMVNRFREELQRGQASRKAAANTVLTAGRSVAFSGMTVAIAMAGLMVPPVAFVRSIGVGGVLVVCLAVLASLTALPALLALLGPKVNSPRKFNITWAQSGEASNRWTKFARRVTKRPALTTLACGAFLLMLSLPTLGIKTGYAGAWGLVEGVESRDALKDVQAIGAGGLLSQFEIVIDLQGQRYSPSDSQRFREVVQQLQQVEGFKAVVSPFMRPSDLSGNASSAQSLAMVSALMQRSFSQNRDYLRLTLIPNQTIHTNDVEKYEQRIRQVMDASGYQYLMGGEPLGGREFNAAIMNTVPTVVLFVFVGTFILLLIAFRSLLIPLKSIVMNVLTVTAAIGITKLAVQDGWMAGVLGIPSDVGVLDSSLPILLFAVMFGLSMDYEIFLLSRVQEEHLRGTPNDEAVVQAVGFTARIITSAALIMFVVFAAFMMGRVVATKSIGLGLTIAVLLDATLVRLVLVPAFLKWAGEWNWWLPKWLDKRLPKIRLEH